MIQTFIRPQTMTGSSVDVDRHTANGGKGPSRPANDFKGKGAHDSPTLHELLSSGDATLQFATCVNGPFSRHTSYEAQSYKKYKQPAVEAHAFLVLKMRGHAPIASFHNLTIRMKAPVAGRTPEEAPQGLERLRRHPHHETGPDGRSKDTGPRKRPFDLNPAGHGHISIASRLPKCENKRLDNFMTTGVLIPKT